MSQVTLRSNLEPFDTIPYELALHIFGFLSEEDRARASRTCKLFNTIANDSTLWKNHNKISGHVASNIEAKPVSFRYTSFKLYVWACTFYGKDIIANPWRPNIGKLEPKKTNSVIESKIACDAFLTNPTSWTFSELHQTRECVFQNRLSQVNKILFQFSLACTNDNGKIILSSLETTKQEVSQENTENLLDWAISLKGLRDIRPLSKFMISAPNCEFLQLN